MDFQMIENDNPLGTIIKVIGVGGAGNNAVQHMIAKRVQGVEFICMNTDAQALRRSNAKYKLQLGKTGLGAGARPEVGKAAAEEAREEIKHLLQGSNMVFITAGMGGGTGTGAAPVVAKIAKEMGILTVGVVSKPFEFEGAKRMNVAEQGANELQAHVDSLIIVLNERLFSVMGEDAEMDKCFECADDVLNNAVAGIAEIINVDGLINVDFEDVKTVMSEQGKAMMGTATIDGPERARLAAELAVASPLLEGVDLSGARGVLVNITASRSLKLSETKQVMNTIRSYAAKDATVIFGSVYSDECGDSLRVTVVATGLGGGAQPQNVAAQTIEQSQHNQAYTAQMNSQPQYAQQAPQAPQASPQMHQNNAYQSHTAAVNSNAHFTLEENTPIGFISNTALGQAQFGQAYYIQPNAVHSMPFNNDNGQHTQNMLNVNANAAVIPSNKTSANQAAPAGVYVNAYTNTNTYSQNHMSTQASVNAQPVHSIQPQQAYATDVVYNNHALPSLRNDKLAQDLQQASAALNQYTDSHFENSNGAYDSNAHQNVPYHSSAAVNHTQYNSAHLTADVDVADAPNASQAAITSANTWNTYASSASANPPSEKKTVFHDEQGAAEASNQEIDGNSNKSDFFDIPAFLRYLKK